MHRNICTTSKASLCNDKTKYLQSSRFATCSDIIMPRWLAHVLLFTTLTHIPHFAALQSEQFIGDSCAANPFSVNIRLPVSKRFPKRKLNKATKSATYVLNETVYCTNHCLPVRYWCHQCNAAKCGICVNVVNSRTCANHLGIIMSEHVATFIFDSNSFKHALLRACIIAIRVFCKEKYMCKVNLINIGIFEFFGGCRKRVLQTKRVFH
jgi:hypothetical protein